MKDREKKEYEEQNEFNDDLREGDTETIGHDISLSQTKNYPGDMTPQDLFQYKKMRIQPEATTDFPGVVDKDWVMANMGGNKPNLQHKMFEVGTYNLIRSIFVKKAKIPLLNAEGKQACLTDGTPLFMEGMVFDEMFKPVSDYILAGIKGELVGSRAMGPEREAVLDITTGIRKVSEKKKEQNNSIFGLGR